MEGFGFPKRKKENLCKTFESKSPPSFEGDSISFSDEKTGGRHEYEADKVKNLRRTKDGRYKIRICRRE